MRSALVAVLVASVAMTLAAQLHPQEFGKGPAQWLMTSEEQRAWRDVKTDDQAIDFIDLFWARRDPTPGTPRNENRIEFESRVAYADKNFKEGKLRGALTERGRVLIVLGYPKDMSQAESNQSSQYSDRSQGFNPEDPTGGRAMAARDVWEYPHDMAVKYGMPKIEVVFVHDRAGGGIRRDPLRMDFTMALPAAIRSLIVSPGLTTLPPWADSSRIVMKQAVVAADQRTKGEHTEDTVTYNTVKKQVIVDVPAPVAKPAGTGNLMLLNDSMSLEPQSGKDPFAAVSSVARFTKDHDLGWAAEYCSGKILANAPSVRVRLKIVAADGDSFSTDPEEFVPDSVKADPGCYLLRGALPLAGMTSGDYKVTLSVEGAGAGQSYNLTRDFRVE